ncbi:MAG TPA: flagellar motor protein MotB [Candidatus Acidoferrales bacterium]|nr:flagellar motor protein MotB [Candidatus Acidoferrales bacterium]HTX57796.1 flagellar motor protein MotB [Candidatus Acidoferrales bacterium]
MAQPIKSAARAAESNRPRKKSEEKLETAGMMRWLLTYADMITLMLALFIILFAMSTISRVKVQEFAKSVSAGFDNVWTVNQPPNGGANGEQSFQASSSIPAIQKELEKYVKENHLEQQVQVHAEARGLVVTLLSDKSFYDSGSAEIRPATLKILDGIVPLLKRNNNQIAVEGYTDNVPISNSLYKSNWELSTARAANVTEYLQQDGVTGARLSATGYSEYRPRNGNVTDEQKQQNRRVDIVLLSGSAAPGSSEKGP